MAAITGDQAWFETLFELAPDAYYLSDLKGTFIAGNEAAEELVGYQRHELIGKSFLSLNILSATDVPRAVKLLALSVAGKRTGPDEMTLRCKNGSSVCVEIRTRPVKFQGQRLVLGIARDISMRKLAEAEVKQAVDDLERRVDERTQQLQHANAQLRTEIEERKAVEATLRENQRFLHQIANSATHMVWTYDLQDNRNVFANPSLADFFGLPIDEIASAPGSFFRRQIHPDDLETYEEHGRLCRTLTDDEVLSRELRVRNRAGEYRWLSARDVILERSVDGSPSRILGTAIDITERKTASEELVNRENLYNKAIAAADAVAYQFDFVTDSYVYIDPQIEKLLGYSVAEFTPAIWNMIGQRREVRGELADLSYAEALQRHRDGEFAQWHADYECTTKDGDIVWLADSSVLLRDDRGRPTGSFGILQDISERKRAVSAIEARSRQQAAVVELGKLALAGVPVAELRQEAVAAVAAGLEVEMAKVMELSEDKQSLRFETSIGWDNVGLKNRVVKVTENSQAGLTIQTNEPVVVEHLPSDVRFVVTQPLEDHHVISGVTVVIQGQSEPYGVLGVHTRQRRSFSTTDINFVQSIANSLGEAIEREYAVGALVKSEQRLRLVTDAMPAFISYLRADRCYGFVNRYYEERFGFTQGEIVGKPVWDVLGGDVYQVIKPRIDAALAGQYQQFDAEIVLPGIGRRTLNAEYLPDISPEGVVRGYYTFAFDITDRQESEETIRQSEHRLRMVTEHIPSYIAYIDADERYQFVNQRNADFKGLPVREIIGRHLSDIVPDERYRRLQPRVQRVLAGEELEFEQTSNYGRHGTLSVHTSLIPDLDEDGDVCGYYSFTTDVTRQRHAEEQAREHLDQLAHVMRLATAGEMATGLAHELNQPLTASMTYADICLSRVESSPADVTELTTTLKSLKQQIVRASEIIRRMRSYVKKERFSPIHCELDELFNDVLTLLSPQLRTLDIRVDVSSSDRTTNVYVDQVQVEQVLFNILQNAIESIGALDSREREPGWIEIKATDWDEEFVEVTVCDSGRGVSAAAAGKIFDAFYSTKSHGMGMGLAICRTIIEAHGGRIELSPTTNRGTSIRLTLPKVADGQLDRATVADD